MKARISFRHAGLLPAGDSALANCRELGQGSVRRSRCVAQGGTQVGEAGRHACRVVLLPFILQAQEAVIARCQERCQAAWHVHNALANGFPFHLVAPRHGVVGDFPVILDVDVIGLMFTQIVS
jgi:hypothetical protein